MKEPDLCQGRSSEALGGTDGPSGGWISAGAGGCWGSLESLRCSLAGLRSPGGHSEAQCSC